MIPAALLALLVSAPAGPAPRQATSASASASASGVVDAASAPPAPERVAPAPLQPGLERVTFDEAVRRALARSTAVLVAAEEVRRAEALLWQARADALPTLSGNASYTRADADRVSSGTVLVSRDELNANAVLAVPLVAPSRWFQWAHGAEAVSVAGANEVDVRRTSALTAARAYLTILAQRRALAVSLQARDNARAHYEFARARRQAGLGNALDELRADQQLGTSEAQVERTYASLAQAREALAVLVGAEAPLDAAEEPELPIPDRPGEALRMAEGRPDVAAGRQRAAAASHVARDSWGEWLPTVLATAQPFYQQPPTTTTPRTGWQAQLVLTWPLFDGGARIGRRRERDAAAREATDQLDLLLRQARSEVRVSWESMIRAENAYASSRRAAARAAAVLALAMRAYQVGSLTSLDVIDAERQARDADTDAVIAEDAVRQSRVNLLAAMGRFP